MLQIPYKSSTIHTLKHHPRTDSENPPQEYHIKGKHEQPLPTPHSTPHLQRLTHIPLLLSSIRITHTRSTNLKTTKTASYSTIPTKNQLIY